MARPRKDNPLVVLSVRVERVTADRVCSLAERTDRPESELLRLIVGLGLDALEATRDEPSAPKRRRKRETLEQQLWQSIERNQDPKTRLVSVPIVVRELRDAAIGTVESIIDVLKLLDQQRHIELRPESGIALLSKADAALCPKGLLGEPCSWLRVL